MLSLPGGWLAIMIFGTLLIGQTSTVMDSALNYFSSLVSVVWLKKEQVLTSRVAMVVFLLLAWLVSLSKVEIWTVLIMISAVRVTMFIPLVVKAFSDKEFPEAVVFYSSLVAIATSFTFAWIAKMDKLPIFDMYAALSALFIPLTAIGLSKIFKR